MRIFQVIGFLLITTASFGFDSDLISERPGQALSPNCLKAGLFQIQSGHQSAQSTYTGPRLFLSPEVTTQVFLQNTVVRFGVSELFEFNTVIDYNFKNTAFASPIVGFKTVLLNQTSNQLSVQYNATINQFNDDLFQNALLLISNHQITSDFSVGLNAGVNFIPKTAEINASYVVSLAYSVTQRFGMVLENYGNYTSDLNTFFDIGFGYLITPVLQIDTYFGGGVNNNYEDIFINTGVTYRFGKAS